VDAGSDNDWGFEEAIFNTTTCTTITLDCTVEPKLMPDYIKPRTTFHPYCLAASDYVDEKHNRQYFSWGSLLEAISLDRAPTILKMDIEGFEFPALKSILDAGLHMPDQVLHVVLAKAAERY
jgi:hypothetical protein